MARYEWIPYVVDVAVGKQTSTASDDGQDGLPERLYRLQRLSVDVFLLRHVVLARLPVEELHGGVLACATTGEKYMTARSSERSYW